MNCVSINKMVVWNWTGQAWKVYVDFEIAKEINI